jgi:quercetin dioxygenase-like cupin family protein
MSRSPAGTTQRIAGAGRPERQMSADGRSGVRAYDDPMEAPTFERTDDLVAAAHVPERGILSQTISDADDVRVVLFGFAPGEELSEHTSARAALLEIVSGTADMVVGGEAFTGVPGTWVRMPPRMAHSIHATSPLVLLLTLLPEQP